MNEDELREAKRELDRRECAMRGHDYDPIVTAPYGAVAILCNRCGLTWSVKPD